MAYILDLLNDRILKGSKIRAQYVASISLSSSTVANPDATRIQNLGSRNVEIPNYDLPSYKKPESEEEQQQADDQLPEEEEKPSILSRIVKNKK